MPTIKGSIRARAEAADKINGTPEATRVKPTVAGIARRRQVAQFVARAVGAADALETVLRARDSGDPTSEAIAEKLLSNPEFLRALSAALETLKADIAAAAKTTNPVAEYASGGDDPNVGPDHPEAEMASANHLPNSATGSGLPGTDAAATAPGGYTVAHLMRDIAIEKGAVVRLSAKIGTDAAVARVAASPLVPPWDSNVWTEDARRSFRDRASWDGAAAAILKAAGDEPSFIREHDAAQTPDLYKLHPDAHDR